jgi:hypothetical protein
VPDRGDGICGDVEIFKTRAEYMPMRKWGIGG